MAQDPDQNSTTAYNLTIRDTSPRVLYIPSPASNYTGEPDLNAGWSQYIEDVGFSTFPGQSASGNSLHVTTRNRAELSIPFTGTGIEIFGILFDAMLSLDIDGINLQNLTSDSDSDSSSTTSPDSGDSSQSTNSVLLGAISGLDQGSHVLTLTTYTSLDADESSEGSINGTGLVIFDRVVVSVSTSRTGASVETDSIPDTEVSFTGSWTFVNDSDSNDGDSSFSEPSSFHLTQNAGDQALYTFQGSAIELTGLTNSSSGLFNISLISSNGTHIFDNLQLSGLSSFLSYSTLFYAYGLNESFTHTLTITNAEDKTLAVDGLNITVVSGGKSVSSSSPPVQVNTVPGLSAGAITGIAIASTFALLALLIAIAIFLVWCKRRRRSIQRQQEAGYGPWPRSRSESRNASRTQSALYVGGYLFDKKRGSSFEAGKQMRKVESPLSPARVQDRSPLHRRMFSTDIVAISPIRPGRRASVPQSVLVGDSLSAIHEGQDITEVDIEDNDPDQTEKGDDETDSGFGDEKKRQSFVSSSVLHTSTVPNLTSNPYPSRSNTLSRALDVANNTSPTRRGSTTRRQSNPLARWSGWFTSSSRSSSDSSKASFQLSSVPPSFPSPAPMSAQTARNPMPLFERPRSALSTSLGAQAREMLVSFLDFASSASGSQRDSTRSRTRSQRRNSSSNKSMAAQSNASNIAIHSTTTASGTRTPRSARTPGSGSYSNGNGVSTYHIPSDAVPQSSGGSGSGSTGMWTLSLSVEPPREPGHVRDSQDLVPHTAVSVTASPLEPPPGRHPLSMASADLHPQRPNVSSGGDPPESPTDSLPMSVSVSDINFRNDEDDEASPISPVDSRNDQGTRSSRTVSAGHAGSMSGMPRFLPRHPPLPRTSPTTPQSYTYAYNSTTPTRLDYGQPTLARSGHMRQMSAPDLSIRYGQPPSQGPYEAQTAFGRRLAQVRAEALEAQIHDQSESHRAESSRLQIDSQAEEASRPSNRGFRALPIPPLPFMHSRSGSSGRS